MLNLPILRSVVSLSSASVILIFRFYCFGNTNNPAMPVKHFKTSERENTNESGTDEIRARGGEDRRARRDTRSTRRQEVSRRRAERQTGVLGRMN